MKGWEKSSVESTGDYLWTIIWLFLPVEYISLGMEKEVWEIADTSQNIIQTHGEWELLGINKATPKKSVGTNLYDQIIFYVSSEAFAFSFLLACCLQSPPNGYLPSFRASQFYHFCQRPEPSLLAA